MHGTTIPYFTGKMLIGGELVESKGGGWLESINPADETRTAAGWRDGRMTVRFSRVLVLLKISRRPSRLPDDADEYRRRRYREPLKKT